MDRGLTCRGLVNGRLAGRTTSEPDFGGRRETLALLTFSLHRTSRLELLGARARENPLIMNITDCYSIQEYLTLQVVLS
jgi:hypothetical protein